MMKPLRVYKHDTSAQDSSTRRMITGLKEGSGKELHHLLDMVQQHLRAWIMSHLGPFITSVLVLKLDSSTIFEWQRFSKDTPTDPLTQAAGIPVSADRGI